MPTEGDRQFIDKWKALGPILEAEREQIIRETDTARDVKAMGLASRHAVQSYRPGPSCGLAELHRWLPTEPHADQVQK